MYFHATDKNNEIWNDSASCTHILTPLPLHDASKPKAITIRYADTYNLT